MKLIPGRRYEWHINNIDFKKKDGLFTGEFDEKNGNALLRTRNGEMWSVPAEDLKPKMKR